MSYKFNVGDKVIVHYKNGVNKMGRVEAISHFIFNSPCYYVSINGLKHHKKCKETELSIVDYKKKYNELEKQVKKFLDINSDFENFVVEHMLDLADEQETEYNNLCEKQEEELHNLRVLVD